MSKQIKKLDWREDNVSMSLRDLLDIYSSMKNVKVLATEGEMREYIKSIDRLKVELDKTTIFDPADSENSG